MGFQNHAPYDFITASIDKHGFGPGTRDSTMPLRRSSKTRDSLEIRDPNFPEPTLPPSGFLKDNPMCILVGAALGICSSLTQGFTTMDPTIQAQCLCYSSTIWVPDIFDDAVGQCATYAITAAPEAYGPLAVLDNFCERVGDVEGPKSASATTTRSEATLQLSNGCAAASSALAKCAAKSSAFEDLEPTKQAECLCYDSAFNWDPISFINAVSSCGDDVQNANMTFYSSITPISSICVGLGNSLTTHASTSMLTLMSTYTTPIPASNGGRITSSTKGTGVASSHTAVGTTITTRTTKPPIPVETNKGSYRKVEIVNIVGISFCCAFVLFFLC